MTETPSSTVISTKLERIAKLAKERPGIALTTLAHHIDIEWLREAYRRTRKGGAAGIDGQSAEQYAEHAAPGATIVPRTGLRSVEFDSPAGTMLAISSARGQATRVRGAGGDARLRAHMLMLPLRKSVLRRWTLMHTGRPERAIALASASTASTRLGSSSTMPTPP
jgi:hypothetical protein